MLKHACRIVLVIGIALSGLAAGGCTSDAQVIQQANKMHGGLKPAVMSDPRLNGYITRLGDRVIDAGRDMHGAKLYPDAHASEDSRWMFDEKRMAFHFVNSQTLNAFTTGGEHMYIYTKLFQTCKTEDELAAVMAHEYAHVYSRHVHKGMNRQMALIGGAAALGAAGYAIGGKDSGAELGMALFGAGLIAGRFVGMSFTRGDESEADDYGFDAYVRAGWDPRKFGDFFQRMVDMGYDKTPEMLSDHPSLASRKKIADKRAGELPRQAANWRKPNTANPGEFKALQDRSVAVGKTMPSDKTLEKAQLMLASLPRSCWTPVEQEDEEAAQQQLLKWLEAEKEVKKPKDRAKKK
jgi:predicted Zn-dependent protease